MGIISPWMYCLGIAHLMTMRWAVNGIEESITIPYHWMGGISSGEDKSDWKGKIRLQNSAEDLESQATNGGKLTELHLRNPATRPLSSSPCWLPFLPLSPPLLWSVGLSPVPGACQDSHPSRTFQGQFSLLGIRSFPSFMCVGLLLTQVSSETLSLSILLKPISVSPSSISAAHFIFFIDFLTFPNYLSSLFNHLPPWESECHENRNCHSCHILWGQPLAHRRASINMYWLLTQWTTIL